MSSQNRGSQSSINSRLLFAGLAISLLLVAFLLLCRSLISQVMPLTDPTPSISLSSQESMTATVTLRLVETMMPTATETVDTTIYPTAAPAPSATATELAAVKVMPSITPNSGDTTIYPTAAPNPFATATERVAVQPTETAVLDNATVMPLNVTDEPTATLPESLTVTATPISTLDLITSENVSNLKEVARFGRGRISGEVAYSPNGRVLAVGTSNGVYLYDANTLKVIRLLDSQTWITRLAFSPNNQLLATNDDSNNVQLWNIEAGQLLYTLSGLSSPVTSIRFSPDGTHIAASGCRRQNSNNQSQAADFCIEGEVKLWQVSDGTPSQAMIGHQAEVTAISFHPDGQWLASGSSDKSVQIWDVPSGRKVKLLEVADAVSSVEFSPNGSLLGLGLGNRDRNREGVQLWHVESWKEAKKLAENKQHVNRISFSADSSMILAGGLDHTIQVWNVQTGQLLNALQATKQDVSSVSFNSNGSSIASASCLSLETLPCREGAVELWSIKNNQRLGTLQRNRVLSKTFGFHPDHRMIATGSFNQHIDLWHVDNGATLKRLHGHTDKVISMDFSPDGTRLASGAKDKSIRVWNVSSGEQIRVLNPLSSEPSSIAFSPDSSIIAAGSSDGTVSLSRASDGQRLHHFKTGSAAIREISFNHDASLLAVGLDNATIQTWYIPNGTLVNTLKGHTGQINSIVFTSDNARLASGSSDGTARLWDTASGQALGTFTAGTPVTSVAFTIDNALLTAGSSDGAIRLWTLSDTTALMILHRHTEPVINLNFSADGQFFTSTSLDGTIRQWGVME